ncbi:MAG: hypothetical protein DRI90_07005 [Deltaproteobacteria bacterium]|nr:MAG: hypothetical protein DRI90_07005 [Deltaproteobacteria bacterium]
MVRLVALNQCTQCGYPSQGSLTCPRCGAQLEAGGLAHLVHFYTNTWTGQLVGGCGCLVVIGVAIALYVLLVSR